MNLTKKYYLHLFHVILSFINLTRVVYFKNILNKNRLSQFFLHLKVLEFEKKKQKHYFYLS